MKTLITTQPGNYCSKEDEDDASPHLDLREDGEHRGGDAEQHVDADEDLVLGAAVRVGEVQVEHDQGQQGQQVVQSGD